ncbi:unnamed protein product [Gordionus sp. m RMFG-2023]
MKVKFQLIHNLEKDLPLDFRSRIWNIPVSGEVTITSYRDEHPYTLQYNDSRIFHNWDMNGNYIIHFQ